MSKLDLGSVVIKFDGFDFTEEELKQENILSLIK